MVRFVQFLPTKYRANLDATCWTIMCIATQTNGQNSWKQPEKKYDIQSMGISESWNGGTVPYKAIFCGDIALHRPYIGLMYGMYLQFRFLKWPLIQVSSVSSMHATPDLESGMTLLRIEGVWGFNHHKLRWWTPAKWWTWIEHVG